MGGAVPRLLSIVVLLLFLIRRGLFGLWDEMLEMLGRAQSGPGIDWERLWDALSRYLALAGLLCLWLLAWGIATRRRQQRLPVRWQ